MHASGRRWPTITDRRRHRGYWPSGAGRLVESILLVVSVFVVTTAFEVGIIIDLVHAVDHAGGKPASSARGSDGIAANMPVTEARSSGRTQWRRRNRDQGPRAGAHGDGVTDS